MKTKFYETDSDGMINSRSPLFDPEIEPRAAQILDALSGLRVCSASHLLDLCKIAILQMPVKIE